MVLTMNLGESSYKILVEKGVLSLVSKHINTQRKVLIVTDDGVPSEYSRILASQCKEPFIVTLPQGESAKSFDNYKRLLKFLLENNFTRSDCLIALGGGVVGDLGGFTASSYMRGIDFYNIPTTLLAQIDSSIGGKTAINLEGVKNIVGAFYQPKMVFIDVDTLKTLPKRQISNGLAEAVKMALTSDSSLFELLENENIENNLEKIIIKSLNIKKSVVEKDEKEKGLRKILNFGHTIGHSIEALEKGKLYHGECVALGMIPMCSEEVKLRLLPLLKKLELPTAYSFNNKDILSFITHDKKFSCNKITLIKVNKIGEFTMVEASARELSNLFI